MELPVVKYTGEDTGKKVKLAKEVFGVKPNEHAMYLDVKLILANRRQGTHKAKEKAEITGSTRKIKKQKGTGTARAGSIKSPIFRGGGRIFGPQPKEYGFKLNKKVRKLARRSALSDKAENKHIILLEDFSFKTHKTKNYVSMLNSLSLSNQKTLLVLTAPDKHIVLAGRNLKKTQITTLEQLNTYDLVNAEKLLLSESAVKILQEN